MKPLDINQHKEEFFRILGRMDKSQVGVMALEPGGDSEFCFPYYLRPA